MTKARQNLGPDLMSNVGGIVLGGGRGTRLQPLTKVRAKPAVPLCGRYRLIDIPLSNCIHSGVKRIVVLTQFNSHSLNRHLANTYHFDSFTNGHVTLLAAEQTEETGDWFQGTADAVRKHLSHIHEHNISHYLILSGDQLYRMDFRKMMATHLKKDADITVAALPVNRADARGFGVMKVNKDARIQEFVEKPQEDSLLDTLVTPENVFSDFGLEAQGKPYLASMGIYLFKAPVLESLLLEHSEWVDFGKELLPNALNTHALYAHMFDGFWEDIGTIRSYFDVSMAMTSNTPPFEFHDEHHPIFTHQRALPGARIQNADITNAIICAGCRIHGSRIKNAIIGVRGIVQAGATIKNSVILGADFYERNREHPKVTPIGIGENSSIENAIIDHNARIGKNVILKGNESLENGDGDGYTIQDGIIVVHKNACIPDNTVIQ